MAFSVAATATALLHLAFILFVILGGLLALRWPAVKWLHLPAAVWGVLIELGGWYCPLTRLENLFRARADMAGYHEGFVAHYAFALIYPSGLTRGIEVALGVAVLLINVIIYMKVFR